jgi:hypothetical protein
VRAIYNLATPKEGAERYNATQEEVGVFVITHAAGHNAELRHSNDHMQFNTAYNKQKGNRSFGYIVFYKDSLQGTIMFKIINEDSVIVDYLDCVMKSFSTN